MKCRPLWLPTSGNHAVVEQYQLFDCVNRTALAHQGCLQPEKIDELYEKLLPLTQKSAEEKEKHIEEIRKKSMNKEKHIASNF